MPDRVEIAYAVEPDLTVDAFIGVLAASGLAERRPVDDLARIAAMVANAQLIVTARTAEGRLVGVARSITDHAYCLYCSDLAVDRDFQGRGIGKALLAETVRLVPGVRSYLLISAPGAVGFYEAAGYPRIGDCFLFGAGA